MEDETKMLQSELFSVPEWQNSSIDMLMHVELCKLQVLLGLDMHFDVPDAFLDRSKQAFVFVELLSVSLSLNVQIRTCFAEEILIFFFLLHFLYQVLAHYYFLLVHSEVDLLQYQVFNTEMELLLITFEADIA